MSQASTTQTGNNRTAGGGEYREGEAQTYTPARELSDAVETLLLLQGRQNVNPIRVAENTRTLLRLMEEHPDATYGVEGIPPKGPGWWLCAIIGADQDVSSRMAVRTVKRDIRERLRFRG